MKRPSVNLSAQYPLSQSLYPLSPLIRYVGPWIWRCILVRLIYRRLYGPKAHLQLLPNYLLPLWKARPD